jgi:O-antigen ligase
MFKGYWLQYALNFSLCIIAFAIPFPYIYSAAAIALCAVVWALQFNLNELLYNLKTRRILWLWVLFFLLHALSYCYSLDKNESIVDLKAKVSFIILPIVIGAGITIDKKILERIFMCFVAGGATIGIFCISRALVIYNELGTTMQFFYHPLINGLDANAVYQALYALFSISILLFFPWDAKYMKILKIPLLILQIVFFILLSSRTLILIFFVAVLPIYLRHTFIKKEKSFLYTSILLLFSLILAIIIFETNNPIKKRYSDIINQNEKITWNDYQNNKQREFNNLSLRLFLWRVGIDNVKENNLWWKGAGNGSVNILQNKKMAEYGITDIYNKENRSLLYNINLHNMYIETLIMLGIPGLIILILIVFAPFTYMKKFDYKNILFVFNFSFLVLMLQEASLQTQAGVIFYTFFSMVIYNHVCSEMKEKKADASQ